jgi:hypothetical protein
MAKSILLTTTVELDAQTVLNLGPGGGYRAEPTINNLTGTTAVYPAQLIRADRTGSTIRMIRGFAINIFPSFSAPVTPNPTNSTNPTIPTNPTEAPGADIFLSSTAILYFDAVSQTVYRINQPAETSANLIEQVQVGNWLGYLTAEAKGIKNLVPYSGVLLGENKYTDIRLIDTSVVFTTARIKPGTAKSTGDGLIVIWSYDGKVIDKATYARLTSLGYKIPPIGNLGYSQTTINLNFILHGPDNTNNESDQATI